METNSGHRRTDKFSSEFKSHDGYNFTAEFTPGHNVLQHLDNLNSLTFSVDEVVIASYPKSGSHWVYEIVNMLTTGSLNYTTRIITTYAFDFQTTEMLSKRDYKVFGTHYYPRFLPKDFMEKHNKIIYVYRNPKDIIVSYVEQVNKLNMETKVETDGFVERFLKGTMVYGKWIDHFREWDSYKQKHPKHPVLFIAFEDLKENLLQEVKKISDFLETGHPESFLQGVAEKCDFTTMAKYKHDNVPESVKAIAKDCHQNTNIFFHRGVVGNWKNVLTVRQSERVDEELSDAIQELGYKIRYSL